ncbi:hypothetical protein ScPMuIL_017366 [Solemya velum]
MPKLQSLDICLDNPTRVYFPRQTISGQLILKLEKTVRVRGIRLKFKGVSNVTWTVGGGENSRTVSAKEEYFNFVTLLCGRLPGGDGEDIDIQTGSYVYGFTFVLPDSDIPTSYMDEIGDVMYSIKATVDRQMAKDYKTTTFFTVLNALDLNTIPGAGTPAQLQQSKTVCCLCCASGPVTGVFRIDKRGYVPGEFIVIDGEVVNESSRTIVSIKAKLKMETTYQAGTDKTVRSKTAAKLEDKGIGPMESATWVGERLEVPSLATSSLAGCSLIDIRYVLKVTADIKDTPFDLTISLPITVGTLPVIAGPTGQFSQQTQAVSFQATSEQVVVKQPTSEVQSPTPSYVECVFSQKDRQNETNQHATLTYTPSYPYYNHNPTDNENK